MMPSKYFCRRRYTPPCAYWLLHSRISQTWVRHVLLVSIFYSLIQCVHEIINAKFYILCATIQILVHRRLQARNSYAPTLNIPPMYTSRTRRQARRYDCGLSLVLPGPIVIAQRGRAEKIKGP